MANDLGAYLRKVARYVGIGAAATSAVITLEPFILGNTNTEVKPSSGIEQRLNEAPKPPRKIIYPGGVAYAQEPNVGDTLPKTNVAVDYDGLSRQAEILVKNRDYRKALEILKPYESDPANNSTAFYNTLAASYDGLNELGMAERSYLKAIKINPKNHIARINLANVYIDQGRREEAKKQFEAILEFDPNNKMAASFLKRLKEGKL